ncbi:MAG: 2-oxo acid dehydrogenase subunit E2 [Spirochaetaceae bacterium]|nr:2-oxo acid dehydrogenase subunit E2 [Spirochaetaceae bacterium]
MATDVTLPELGENIEAGDVAAVLVNPGDRVEKDAPLLELETDKAVVEVPAPEAGVVTAVLVKAGDTISVGDTIASLEPDGAGAAAVPEPGVARAAQPASAADASSAAHAFPAPAPPQPVAAPAQAAGGLLAAASGVTAPSASTAPAAPQPAKPEPLSGPGPGAAPEPPAAPVPTTAPAGVPAPEAVQPVPATPAVRRLAREIGVDITAVTGTGEGGRILLDDVKATAKRLLQAPAPAAARLAGAPLPDFAQWGPVEEQAMNAVRRATTAHLSAAWQTIPAVTQLDKADITDLERLRKRYAPRAEAAGGKLTVTAILVKVVATALKVFPQFSASIDVARATVIYKRYCHVGIAVDTDRGLLVPVIRDADRKNIVELAAALGEMSQRARARKLSPAEMAGGSFTISNLGGIGGSHFSPIINAPEVAILGVSRAETEPVWRDGEFVPRLRLPLSLTYDHRLIDGADGIRFLRWIIEALEQPLLLALEG